LSKIAFSPNASGTGTFTVAAPNTNTDYTLTLPQGTGTVVANNVNSAIVSATAQASTSGTSIDFTGIPSWVKRITVMFSGVSTNGTSPVQVQLGDSGGFETTGYATSTWTANTNNTNYTSGFVVRVGVVAAVTLSGHVTITLSGANLWVGSGVMGRTDAADTSVYGGNKTLSDTLTQVRVTTVNGTDTFDAGSINIFYE
jgi:hypothetical protein